MKIGIDARLIGETGVGRYIRNLIKELGEIDTKNSYVVFTNSKHLPLPNARWVHRYAGVPWHSVKEQILMPGIFAKEKLDLLHVPYHNAPLLYFGKFVITVHDVTTLHFDTGKASTWPLLFYKLKRLGYLVALNAALSRAQQIIAVSQTTKKEILDHFDVASGSIKVIYEG